MKRILTLALTLILMFTAGCSGGVPDGVSDRAYELGCAALETIDDYIAGKLDEDTTQQRLRSNRRTLEAHRDTELEEHGDTLIGTDVWKDDLLVTHIVLAEDAIGNKGAGTGTMSAVKTQRSEIADLLGK